MDANTFREFGKAAVDFIADYMENIRDCDVLPSVEPGYLVEKLPKVIPEQPEHWQEVLKDINDLITPGITHWQSPNFHAFYPTASSYPSMVGDMIANGFSVIGFNWICSPACTELEVVVMDWLATFLKLPEHFLHSSSGPGGGIIQGSASEAVLVAILAAREQAVKKLREIHCNMSESEIRGKLLAYSSDQSNSCIEKSGILAAVPMKLLPADDNFILQGETLRQAVVEDLANGFFPVICIATLGTTGTCATDNIEQLAIVCEENGIWLHVDAAYAGAALALDEYAELGRGLDKVDSLNFNLHKSLMINFDCGAMWLRNADLVVDSFTVNREYLKHGNEQEKPKVPDFRHWQIPLGRRFRALKVWVTFRTIGAAGLRAHVRNYIDLAKRFENYVRNDERFEIVAKRAVGLVCFRVKGENRFSIELLKRITERKKIYMVQAKHGGLHFLRFVICGMEPKEHDVDFAWHEIETQLEQLLHDEGEITQNKWHQGVVKSIPLKSLESDAPFLKFNNVDNFEKSK